MVIYYENKDKKNRLCKKISQAKKIFRETGKKVVYGIDDIRPVCRHCNISSRRKVIEV